MKLIRLLSLVSMLCAMLACPLIASAETEGKITIHVVGLKNDKGVVRIALFNSKDSYSANKFSADQAFKKDVANISADKADYTFTGVPYGEYAIKLLHDERNSGKFLTNILGIPQVEYGFSNNARGTFGPAPFDKARFKLDSPQLDMTIQAIH